MVLELWVTEEATSKFTVDEFEDQAINRGVVKRERRQLFRCTTRYRQVSERVPPISPQASGRKGLLAQIGAEVILEPSR